MLDWLGCSLKIIIIVIMIMTNVNVNLTPKDCFLYPLLYCSADAAANNFNNKELFIYFIERSV